MPGSPVVGIGSRVRVRATGVEHEVTIVGSPAEEGLYRLALHTPLARALLGRSEGDEVKVHVDAGVANFTIVSVQS